MVELIDDLLKNGPRVVNIGLKSFFESCETQGIKVAHIAWQPPAQGDIDLIKLLDKLL